MRCCPLCREVKDLVISHVIPNTFFKRLKKVKGTAIQSDVRPETPIVRVQESWSEKSLCVECEALTNEFDTYIAAFTYNPMRVGVKVDRSSLRYRTYANLNYKKFRLFQLSLLFRASISKHIAFSHINLSKGDIERVRLALINKEPINDKILGCRMVLIWSPVRDLPFNNVVSVPVADVFKHKEIVYFVFGGFGWEFHLPQFGFKQAREGFYVKSNGSLKVPIVDFDNYQPLALQNKLMVAKNAIGL